MSSLSMIGQIPMVEMMIENIVAVVIGILLPFVVFCYILLFGMGASWSVTRVDDDE